jgi:hypothetical protein
MWRRGGYAGGIISAAIDGGSISMIGESLHKNLDLILYKSRLVAVVLSN